jgi:hypothetical protein
MTTKAERWTKKCSDGTVCAGSFGEPVFVPDEFDVCDGCLLAEHNCEPFYEEVQVGGGGYIYEGVPTEQVVTALRKLTRK